MMTISELIRTLTILKRRYGDLEVVTIGVDANTGNEEVLPLDDMQSFGGCFDPTADDGENHIEAIYIAGDSGNGRHTQHSLYSGMVPFDRTGKIEY